METWNMKAPKIIPICQNTLLLGMLNEIVKNTFLAFLLAKMSIERKRKQPGTDKEKWSEALEVITYVFSQYI